MSSANQNSNQFTPQTQKLTRRRFLSALAIAGTLPLVPHIVGLEGVTPQDFRPFDTGLTELITTLATFEAYLQELAGQTGPADPEALYEAYGEASQAAYAIDQVLISAEFEEGVLGPLAGGIERYRAALPMDRDEVISPVEPEPVKPAKEPKVNRELLLQAYRDMAELAAEKIAELTA